jgi:thiamine-phosphate pyrophosphorylase
MRGLYAISPPLADTAELTRICGDALSGGARILQYRNPLADADLRLTQAQALAKIAKEKGAVFIVNDDPQLARAAAADGVHLGKNDPSIAAARRILGDSAIVGVSCYGDANRVSQAQAQGADYVALGAVFASSTKPAALLCADFAACRKATTLPVVAVGGITIQNGYAPLAAGADALAVCAALFLHSADVRAAAEEFCRLFANADEKQYA